MPEDPNDDSRAPLKGGHMIGCLYTKRGMAGGEMTVVVCTKLRTDVESVCEKYGLLSSWRFAYKLDRGLCCRSTLRILS